MSHTVYISAIIHAPLEQVWPMFRDFNGLAGWHPGVAVSRLGRRPRGRTGFGAAPDAPAVRLRARTAADAGRSGTALRYSIIETDLPMRDYVAGVQLRRASPKAG